MQLFVSKMLSLDKLGVLFLSINLNQPFVVSSYLALGIVRLLWRTSQFLRVSSPRYQTLNRMEILLLELEGLSDMPRALNLTILPKTPWLHLVLSSCHVRWFDLLPQLLYLTMGVRQMSIYDLCDTKHKKSLNL